MADEGNDGERFRATNGRLIGVVGLVLTLTVIVLNLISGPSLGVLVGCLLAGLVIWVVLLRPAARVERDDLVLRGPLDTRWIPLASIDRSAVGAILVVRVGERRYTNSAISRSRRQSRNDDKVGADLTRRSYGAYVESRIDRLVEDAHAAGKPAGGVRRAWAWPEIAGLVLLTLALAVAIVA